MCSVVPLARCSVAMLDQRLRLSLGRLSTKGSVAPSAGRGVDSSIVVTWRGSSVSAATEVWSIHPVRLVEIPREGRATGGLEVAGLDRGALICARTWRHRAPVAALDGGASPGVALGVVLLALTSWAARGAVVAAGAGADGAAVEAEPGSHAVS